MIGYIIGGCIVGAIGGAGAALALDLFSCVCYIVSCGNSDAGMSGPAILIFAIIGAIIGGFVGYYRYEDFRRETEEEKRRNEEEALNNILDADYNNWHNRLNNCYEHIKQKVYCKCGTDDIQNLYNAIWELEKEKENKQTLARPYNRIFLEKRTEHINYLRNIIDNNINNPGYYAIFMILRAMKCLYSINKENPRFDHAIHILEELLKNAQKKTHYIKFMQYGDCIVEADDPAYSICLEEKIQELTDKIEKIRTNIKKRQGEFYEKLDSDFPNIIDYSAELMWCIACKKPFNQTSFNNAAYVFDIYTARCAVDNYCTTWRYESEVYAANQKNVGSGEKRQCLLNENVEHLLALIYAKNKVGGTNTVDKEKTRVIEWIDNVIKFGDAEEGFLLASGLAWMGLYDLERIVLRQLFDKKVTFEMEYQDRLSFLESGGNTNIKIFDVGDKKGFLFDSSVEGWNKDAYDMFFRKLEMTHKSLEYSLMISKWTKTLPLASGQEISQSQMEKAFEDLVKDFGTEIILSRETAKAVNLANVEYKMPFIFHFASERNRCVTMLFSSDKFGRNLNISILTMFTPEKDLDNEEMKKYALAIKDNIYVESFRESICQVVDQLIKEKVTIYDEEEVSRKIFS